MSEVNRNSGMGNVLHEAPFQQQQQQNLRVEELAQEVIPTGHEGKGGNGGTQPLPSSSNKGKGLFPSLRKNGTGKGAKAQAKRTYTVQDKKMIKGFALALICALGMALGGYFGRETLLKGNGLLSLALFVPGGIGLLGGAGYAYNAYRQHRLPPTPNTGDMHDEV